MTPTTKATTRATTKKGEHTKAHILETALEMFRERGYEGTTMRAVATGAGVSLGNAYYYFESKDHLIQAFYERSHLEHLAACAEILDRERDLHTRLLGVMRAKLGTAMPYHRFSGNLFKTAADPASPLNPFSDASTPVRREATALFAEVVGGSDSRIHGNLEAHLPKLLWLYQMGIVLFWIHDTSPGCDRSYRLTERTVDLVVHLVRIANLAPLRPVTKIALNLLAELEDDIATGTGQADSTISDTAAGTRAADSVITDTAAGGNREGSHGS